MNDRTTDHSLTTWPRELGRAVVHAAAVARADGFQLEFYDSEGNTLRVVRLTDTAIVDLAGSASVLAAEVDERRR